MERTYKLEILPPAQTELEEIARIHMALSGLPAISPIRYMQPWNS